MEECVFCKIIEGKIEAYKIFEDDKVICILDKKPISKGHCLIIPKKHFNDIFDIDEDDLKQIIADTKKVANLLKTKLNAKGINLLHASDKVAQQSVFHFHIHIVPRYEDDGLDTWPKSNYKEKSFNDILSTLLD
jgi:histidine triad (HIT) family protein